ncbi:hypothetical protein FQN53_004062 [Emmonsiellopsis sp. PD_33]|nr:hypothetical protein FQN53_004062 [Emmonsiellopsis sp. PD_33]
MASSSTVPTLSQPSSSSSSDSIHTSLGEKLPIRYLLDDNGNRNHTTPPPTDNTSETRAGHICFFHILDCNQRFTDLKEWKTHVLSHFRSHPPPTDATCPACPYTISDQRPGVAWRALVAHMADEHLKHGLSMQYICPDLELMRHLYYLHVITQEQLKLVQLPAAPRRPGYNPALDSVRASIGSSDDPCFVHTGRRRDRRMRSRPHGISVA